MSTMQGCEVQEAGKPLVLSEFDLVPLGAEEVEVAMEYCGICPFGSIDDQQRMGHAGSLRSGPRRDRQHHGAWRAGQGPEGGPARGHRLVLGQLQALPTVYFRSSEPVTELQRTISGHHGGFTDRVRAHRA